MKDFLTFRRMITPVIIEILFWLGSIICVLVGLAWLVNNREGAMGLALLVLGPLAVRIYCELLILAFRINETLTDIRNTLKSREPNPVT